jgi:serine/threonine protein kinase
VFFYQPWGTAEYESPELLAGAYGPQADIWAAGCLLYEMLCGGRKAFYPRPGEKNLNNLYKRIKKGEYEFHKCVFVNR